MAMCGQAEHDYKAIHVAEDCTDDKRRTSKWKLYCSCCGDIKDVI